MGEETQTQSVSGSGSENIRDYIAEDNAEKARETIDKMFSVFEKLQIFPGRRTKL